MRRSVFALVVVLAVIALATPAMALSEAMCSAISQGTEKLSGPSGGLAGGILTQNCPSPASNNPVVSTSEPLATLVLGLGLLGARLLRRR